MDNKVLIILGMHRSGTSLTAQWMHKCGIDMGIHLTEPKYDNPQGYYEDQDFVKIHIEILRNNMLSFTGLEGNLSDIKLDKYFEKKILHNLKFKNSLRDQWGWKDPRTCLFLDYYRKYIPEAKYLIVYREPNQVIDSLLRRDIKKYLIGFKKQGIKGKLKAVFKERYLKNILQKSAENYIAMWIYYNQLILNLIERERKDSYFVFNVKDILTIENQLYEQLRRWNFSFGKSDIRSIFDEKLLETSIRQFDERLIANLDTVNIIKNRFNALTQR